jgi:ferredoxin
MRNGRIKEFPMPLIMAAPIASLGTMRLVVDLNKCQGYAQCVPLAPEVLKLNGEEALAYDPNPDESQRQHVLRAAASCPVQAIILELDPPGDRDTL